MLNLSIAEAPDEVVDFVGLNLGLARICPHGSCNRNRGRENLAIVPSQQLGTLSVRKA
jgi:hypothetical protein